MHDVVFENAKIREAGIRRFREIQQEFPSATGEEFMQFEMHLWLRWVTEKHKTIKRKFLGKRVRKPSVQPPSPQVRYKLGFPSAPAVENTPSFVSINQTTSPGGSPRNLSSAGTLRRSRSTPSKRTPTVSPLSSKIGSRSSFVDKQSSPRHLEKRRRLETHQDKFLGYLTTLFESHLVSPARVIETALKFSGENPGFEEELIGEETQTRLLASRGLSGVDEGSDESDGCADPMEEEEGLDVHMEEDEEHGGRPEEEGTLNTEVEKVADDVPRMFCDESGERETSGSDKSNDPMEEEEGRDVHMMEDSDSPEEEGTLDTEVEKVTYDVPRMFCDESREKETSGQGSFNSLSGKNDHGKGNDGTDDNRAADNSFKQSTENSESNEKIPGESTRESSPDSEKDDNEVEKSIGIVDSDEDLSAQPRRAGTGETRKRKIVSGEYSVCDLI